MLLITTYYSLLHSVMAYGIIFGEAQPIVKKFFRYKKEQSEL
jgi:hypothetical protein